MKLYNISTDETEDVTLWRYAKHHLLILKHLIPLWVWHMATVPAAKTCQKCLQNFSRRVHERKAAKNLERYYTAHGKGRWHKDETYKTSWKWVLFGDAK